MSRAEKITAIYRSSGLSRREFCERLGVSEDSLRSWMAGRREPREPVVKLAEKLFHASTSSGQ